MKHIVALAFSILLGPSLAWAQAPTISYLQVDEAQSHLWVIGSFGTTPGTVTIEDTTLGIVSWSDTMIVCSLPDSGHGAGGTVHVLTVNGTSNKGLLSIFHIRIFTDVFVYSSIDNSYHGVGNNAWDLSWRTDLLSAAKPAVIGAFEASKTASGFQLNLGSCSWADSTTIVPSSVSFFGTIDPTTKRILNSTLRINRDNSWSPPSLVDRLSPIRYDLDGTIFVTKDSFPGYPAAWTDHTSGTILFPPSPKDAVHSSAGQRASPAVVIVNNIAVENNSLVLLAMSPEGRVTAKLFDIKGCLLRSADIVLNAPGEYRFDTSGLDHQVGILVLTTDQGVMTQKVRL